MSDVSVVLTQPRGNKGPGDKVSVSVDEARLLILDGRAEAANKTAEKAIEKPGSGA